MRGISGSGKSTRARELAGHEGVIYSTDDWHINDKGQYNFDPSKNKAYHQLNLEDFTRSLQDGLPLLIVDNTNMRKWEYERYVSLAQENGYEVVINEMPMISVDEAVKRNIHGTPKENIERQISNWESSK